MCRWQSVRCCGRINTNSVLPVPVTTGPTDLLSVHLHSTPPPPTPLRDHSLQAENSLKPRRPDCQHFSPGHDLPMSV